MHHLSTFGVPVIMECICISVPIFKAMYYNIHAYSTYSVFAGHLHCCTYRYIIHTYIHTSKHRMMSWLDICSTCTYGTCGTCSTRITCITSSTCGCTCGLVILVVRREKTRLPAKLRGFGGVCRGLSCHLFETTSHPCT